MIPTCSCTAYSKEAGKSAAENGVDYSKSFFEDSKFTNKVKNQMEWPDNHGFPRGVEAFEKDGTRYMKKEVEQIIRGMNI